MQKMIDFYHDKGMVTLKLGCMLPNLVNNCPHNSADYKPFSLSSDSDLLEKLREHKYGNSSIVFTSVTVENDPFVRKSNKLSKSIVGIGASQLYYYSMCQDMPTGLYTRLDYNEGTQKVKAMQNRVRTFKRMVINFFKATIPESKIESYYHTGTMKRFFCLNIDGY